MALLNVDVFCLSRLCQPWTHFPSTLPPTPLPLPAATPVAHSFHSPCTILIIRSHRRCRWLSRYALGGSTNGVLHMLALAREAGVDLTIDEFNRIGANVPFVGNLAPSGK